MATYTVAQCDAQIVALEAALDEIVLLPVKGTTGKTSLDLSGKRAEIEDRIETWQQRRAALLNGGVALRPQRGC